MSHSDEHSARPPTHGSTLLERIVACFEEAWQHGEQPAIDDYLHSDDANSHEILVELVHVDLEFRLKAGEDARVESYLDRYPALGEDRSAKCHLIVAEYTLKLRDQPDLPTEQYYARFPDDRSELQELFSAKSDSQRESKQPQTSTTRIHTDLRIDKESLPMDFGRFQLVALIGRGAFGTVYRAHDPHLARDVAIKIPNPGVLQTQSQVERFLREAKTGAKLRHRNVCPIYDVGEHQGSYYIVMGFIAGTSLSDFIKSQKTVAPNTAARLVLNLTAALAEAHQQGIVHRDLKPSNVIIDDRRREPIVLDYGLAKDLLNPDARSTATGEILGTPAYMSPEQARGARSQIGPKSDIYSLGVVLYHLLTGRLPFRGSSAEIVVGVLDEDPTPPSQHRPDLDFAIESICLKAIAKNPSDRFASMTEFGAALRAYLKAPDRGAQPIRVDRKDTVAAGPAAVAGDRVSARPTVSEHADVPAPVAGRPPVESRTLVPATYLPMTGRPRRESADNTRLIAMAAAVGIVAIILMLSGILLSQYLFREPSDEPFAATGTADESGTPIADTTTQSAESSASRGHASADTGSTDEAEDDPNGLNPHLSLTERLAEASQEASIAENAVDTDLASTGGSESALVDKSPDDPPVTAGPQRPTPDAIGPEQGMERSSARTWNLKDGASFEAEFARYDSHTAWVTWRTADGASIQWRLAELAEEDRERVLAAAHDASRAEFTRLVEQARVSMGDGDYDRAKKLLRSASGMEGEQVRVTFLLGLLSALVDHDFEKAKASFAQCVERSPNNGSFLNNLAITEIQGREFSDALRHWERALISQQDNQVLALIAHNTDILVQYTERHPGAVPEVHKEKLRRIRDKSTELSGATADSDSGWLYLDVRWDDDGTLRPVHGHSIGTLKLEDHKCQFCNVCRGCGLVKCPNTDCRQGYERKGPRRKGSPGVPCNTCQGRKSVPCPHCSGGIRDSSASH